MLPFLSKEWLNFFLFNPLFYIMAKIIFKKVNTPKHFKEGWETLQPQEIFLTKKKIKETRRSEGRSQTASLSMPALM